MNTEWVEEISGRSGIVVTDLEMGDAVPPLLEFWMDIAPRDLRADRLGVAAALIFGQYAAGRFSPPRAISVGTGQAIAAHSEGRVIPMRVHSGVDVIPEQGGVQLVLQSSGSDALNLDNSVLAIRRFGVTVLPTDRYAGRLVAMDRLQVASNAWLHSLGSGVRTVFAQLAVAVLLASDLQASSILCELPDGSTYKEREQLARLLSSVGLGLGWYVPEGREIKTHG